MKAGTATKMVLNMISTSLFVLDGRVWENLMVDVRATNLKLKDRAARIVSQITKLSRPAAFALLDAADGRVKVALAMHFIGPGCAPAAAEEALAAVNGKLHELVGGRAVS